MDDAERARRLRAVAARLRELAVTAGRQAEAVACLLDSVTKLDDAHTWSGGFACESHEAFGTWGRQLGDSAGALRDKAGRWKHAADVMEREAATLSAAAARASTMASAQGARVPQ
ncbi:hypothetical protein [Cellulomonas sp. URHE0023]|uniref:hypothetical protein n=1 Tax=Cellulomonas sp. URHE0023 TaxID=1380354 RepID=UPI00048421D5|nr:hypothetical protein [Cellulomonas sp. URHE0023]